MSFKFRKCFILLHFYLILYLDMKVETKVFADFAVLLLVQHLRVVLHNMTSCSQQHFHCFHVCCCCYWTGTEIHQLEDSLSFPVMKKRKKNKNVLDIFLGHEINTYHKSSQLCFIFYLFLVSAAWRTVITDVITKGINHSFQTALCKKKVTIRLNSLLSFSD